MKQLFFTTAAIAIPGAILLWISWLFVSGVYSVVSDWYLERELKQIRLESKTRGRDIPDSPASGGKSPPKTEATSFALDATSEPQTDFKLPDDERPADL
jgi:hypothetical protein